jgi:large subunit ribosomal protein L3
VIEGLLGRKLGMLQIVDKDGRMRAATVIEAGPCLVTQVRTPEADGYTAVQLGFGAAKRTDKAMRGHLKRLGDLRFLREFRTDDPSAHHVGDRVGVEIFHEGDRVDITAASKGRGFQGGVKRYGFAGGPKTHGQSDRHRAPGAIGSGNTPGRVFKGLRMAGHMGDERVTVRNLEVIESNPARGTLIVAGAVPGARNGLVKIRYAKATREVARTRKPKALAEEPEAGEEEIAGAGKLEAPAAEPAPEASADEPEAAAEDNAGEAPEQDEDAE